MTTTRGLNGVRPCTFRTPLTEEANILLQKIHRTLSTPLAQTVTLEVPVIVEALRVRVQGEGVMGVEGKGVLLPTMITTILVTILTLVLILSKCKICGIKMRLNFCRIF